MYHFGIFTYFEAHTLLGPNCLLHHGHTMWSCLHEATKIQPFPSRLSRSGLPKRAWMQMCPADSCTHVQKSGVDFSFNQDDVPCTSTAHEFVSGLAVPRARLASRQSPVACTMNGCCCIAFVRQTFRCTLDSQAMFYVALRSTNTHISSAKGCVSRFLISHRAEFWQQPSNTTLSNYRETPLLTAKVTIYGHRALTLYLNFAGSLRRISLGSVVLAVPYRDDFLS
jgi:hypothetical protein